MKKVIFVILMALSIQVINAQSTPPKGKGKGKGNAAQGKNMTPEERAEKITNRLKTELSLTDEQVPKVKQATLTRTTQVAAARTKAGEDKKAFLTERKKAFQTWETDMKGILTPEQYNTYLAKKEEKKKKMQEQKKKGSSTPKEEDSEESDE